MSNRIHKNWIKAYLQYNEHTESAVIFHKWCAVSAIAGVLRRKVHFKFGRIKLHPNLYVVLVAEPGIARKSQAISFAEDFLAETYGVHLSADATTPQALLDAVEEAADDTQTVDGTPMRHCSLTICSSEFESFLGHKKENSRMIIILTDLHDCKTRPFKYSTKHSGKNVIPLPFLNLIAGTTPESLANCFPAIAIGGGLSSRMVFVYADNKAKKVAIPEFKGERKKMFETLLKDLALIAKISGEYDYSKNSRKWWEDFYNKYEERDPNRLCKDPAFVAWYSRKPIILLKVATVIAAAQRDDMLVHTQDLIDAKEMLEEIEPGMGNAFAAVGRSDLTADVDMVRKILQRAGTIPEMQLRRMVWRDIDDKKFSIVIDTIVGAGEAKRKFEKNSVIYHWKGK